MSVSVGIDLGTTFSVISYLKADNTVEIIPNKYGNRTTPSVVSIENDGNVLVGEAALDIAKNLPAENTIHTVKRSIGKNKKFKINNIEYSPEQISSEILKYLKECAEEYLGKKVDNAVITVPAYFNNDQRVSTKVAGELAGLNVLRIINEPTAASLAYGLDKKNDSTILVYDLGGGTFDVTVLKLTDGVDFHVLSTAGNTELGGIDFDQVIKNIALNKFKITNSLEGQNLQFSSLQNVKLNEVAEKVKKALSISNKAYFFIDLIMTNSFKYVDLKETISRNEFEDGILNLVNLTKDCIDQALNDAKLSYSDIDEIVFVGGSTRIPFISQKIEEWTGKKPNRSINPDEAVSIGAAIQASVLSGTTDKEVYLVDVTPLSLGIETQGGYMSVMIKRNTHVPAEFKEIFTTSVDDQTSVDVKVYQGERPQTSNNHFLGEFKLENIKKSKRGVPKIEVVFDIDANGILKVKAIDQETMEEQSLVLSGKSSLDKTEIMKILKDAEENKISDERFRQLANYRELLASYRSQINELIETNVLSSKDIDELLDLRSSIDSDYNSENIELLSSLFYSCKETIEEKSEFVYDHAKKILK